MRPTLRLLALLLAVLALPPAQLWAFTGDGAPASRVCCRNCCGGPPACPEGQGGLQRDHRCPCGERAPAPPPPAPVAPADGGVASVPHACDLAPVDVHRPRPAPCAPGPRSAERQRPPPVRTLLGVRQL